MTNHWIDLKNANAHLIMGSNAVENHPIASRWIWKAKEENNATIIHVDPRYTRTSAKADIYAPIRSGTDIAFLGGMIRWMIEKWYTSGKTKYINQKYVEDCTNALFLVRTDFKNCRTAPVGDFSASGTWDYQYGADYVPSQGSGWVTGTGYALNAVVIPTVPNNFRYECIVAGTSGASEPVWPTSIGGTVADGTVTWRCCPPNANIKTPLKAATLDDPACVFQHLRQQYSVYTPQMVQRICGTPAGLFEQICEAYIGGTYADDKAGTMLYAMGWTQHTVGTQNVRAASIIQTLLGNIGVAGGGVDALRGWHNVQGATDHGLLQNLLPGYLSAPSNTSPATLGIGPLDAGSTYLKGAIPLAMDPDAPGNPQSSNWWGMFANQYNRARYVVSLLKAWWPTIDHNTSYSYLPKKAGDCTYLSLMNSIDAGTIKGLFCWGTNPMVMGPDQTFERSAMKKLEWLVVCDLFETETAAFWKNPDENPALIDTEVYFLPGAYAYEKEGSASNSGRLAQWRDKASDPPGDAKDELDIVNDIGDAIQALYPAPGAEAAKDSPIVRLAWPYGPAPFVPGATLAESVAKEINGYALVTYTTPVIAGARSSYTAGNQINTFFHLMSGGETACGNWLYTGTYQTTGNQMKNRDPIDYHPYGIGIYHKWGYSWPVNRRIIYNRAAVYQSTSGSKIMGQPLNPNKPVVWWDTGYSNSLDSGTAESGTANTLTDNDKAWTANQWAGKRVYISAGTGSGQERTISSNTGNTLTVSSNWVINPDATSVYTISDAKWNWNYNNLSKNPNTYPNDVVDGFSTSGPTTWLPYIMREEGLARLMGRGTGLADGPMPEHWEPWETPLDSNILTAGAGPLVSPYVFNYGKTYADTPAERDLYPIVCTTYRLTEHWHGGGFTRNCPTQVEAQPEPFIEISEELAAEKGIANGDNVDVSSVRGTITVKACVTKRFKPFIIDGNMIHQVGLPWHWGWASTSPGESANMLTPYIGDTNTRIPETKVFLVNIAKAP
ncbi:MAG: hypothetical protein FJ241_10360 [Nitrospira sp.]|nr:hypothetical protein [Nitrospira sp.]